MTNWLEKQTDELDATLFTGDSLNDSENRKLLKKYLERWSKRLIEVEDLYSPKCKNCFFNAYGGECQLSCSQVTDNDTCGAFVHELDADDE